MGAYDDIINLPHPTSAKHPRMPMLDRAAQFSPFAALVGHGAAIQETARLTEQRVELTEDEKSVLDEKLRLLVETSDEAMFTYFMPDEKKSGGAYITVSGVVRKIDLLKHCIVLMDGATIPIEDILDIEICVVESKIDSYESNALFSSGETSG